MEWCGIGMDGSFVGGAEWLVGLINKYYMLCLVFHETYYRGFFSTVLTLDVRYSLPL